ncbi:unnamed protein product [Mytilus coruscus]|uniref:Ig-like domain-containing protein n=1 Tax=Mytilus coruscus TaxID=42192 RepID=A0A6J8B2Q4_MYTCO|nr:unnamed protein product [Mytilus coruscus]
MIDKGTWGMDSQDIPWTGKLIFMIDKGTWGMDSQNKPITWAPGSPVITGPTFIVEGNSVALTCTSSGGNPVPTVYWYRNNQLVDDTQTTTNGVTTNTYNFVADTSHNLAVFECQVDNNVLQNKLSTTWFFQVYTEPNQPTLTGSQTLSPGSTYVWTCISTGGNPSPTLTMRIGNSQFNTGITQSSVLQSDNTYTVTSALSWAPSISNNGQTLHCDVQHPETRGNNLQTVSLQLTVNDPLSVSAPQTQYQQNVGTLVVMNCVITGTATSITWYFNNQVINIASSSKYSNGNTINPSLTVSNVALSDAGSYYCQATNGVVTANSNTITLTVLGSIPVVTVSQSTYSGTTGQSVTLQCSVSSPDSTLQSVSWIFNNGASTNIITQFSNTAKYSGITTTTPSLTILNLASTDVGTYTCSATNTIGTGSSSATSLSVTGNLLTVTIPQSSYSVLTGQQVTIPCTVTGTPTQNNVFWRKVVNGVQTNVDINGNSRYSGGTTSSPSLTITNTQSSDEGTYVCYASNNIGTSNSQNTFLDVTGAGTTSSSQTFLDVVGNIPTVSIPQSAYSVNVGSQITIPCVPTVTIGSNYYSVNYGNTATIVCNVVATPTETSISWQKIQNGIPSTIVISGRYQGANAVGTGQSSQTYLDVTGSILTVTVPQSSYSVNYGQSVQLSQQTQLSVVGNVPSVTVGQGYTIALGNSITLTCTVFATPSATSVQWNRITNNVPVAINVASNPTKYSGATVSTPSLTISNSVESDEGYYTCQATNSVGTGTSTQTFLNVQGTIPVVTIAQSQYSVTVGSSVTMVCTVSANPAHTSVNWQRVVNGVATNINLSQTSKYSGSSTSSPSLTVLNAVISDEGYYTCSAQNSVGTGTSSQTFLDVSGSVPVVTVTNSVGTGISSSTFLDVLGNIPVVTTPTAAYTGTYVCYATNSVGTGQSTQVVLAVTGSVPSVSLTQTAFTAANSVGTGQSLQGPLSVVGNVPVVTMLSEISQLVGTGTSNNVYLTVTGDAPTSIAISPSPITVNEGQTITATCTALGSPTISYTWFKGNSNTQLSTGSVLQITSSTRTDAGTYQCRASNTYGNADATVAVEVQYVPDVTITQPSQGSGGQAITIQCSYVSNPGATNVIWSKGNQGITVDGSKYVGGSLSNPSLTINNLAASDQGSYRCSVVNSVGQGDSSSVTLSVDTSTAPSYIRIVPAGVVVQEGQGFTLTCEADGDPAPTYNWYHNDLMIHEGAVLTITNSLWTEHDGLHLCKATNTKGSRQTWEDVDVQHIPVSTVAQTSISQTVGNPVSLSCDTRANPSATAWEWFYNGNSLSSTNKVLVVDMDSASDAGTYTCRATNAVGSSADIAFSIGIGSGIDPGLGASTGESSSLSTGEIAAIILAILFVLLLVIGIIICCCCQGYCASLCGGKKEKVTPQPAPKIVEIPVYYEEPEESVISLRKLEIPRFYEEPVIVAAEPSTNVVRKIRHKKHRTYRRPSDEYEISKYQVLKPDDSRELETTERARENTYVTSTGTRQQYYLPDVEYTYDEEEERRRRRRRRKKKSKRHHEEQVRDNEIIVEDRIENGDVLRSSVRSRRSEHDTLRASTRSRDPDYDVVTGEEFYYEQE